MSDVVVLGANPSGLAMALLLARSRHSVTVVEERDVPGGLFARETFHPGESGEAGFRAPGLVHGPTRVQRKSIEKLGLHKFGLELDEHPESTFHTEPDGPGIYFDGDPARAREAIAERSPDDADAFLVWRNFVDRVAPLVSALFDKAAPDPFSERTADMADLFKTAVGVRRLGNADMLELLRVAPMCAADWFGETFRSPQVIAALTSRGLRGGPNGPWGPHTAGLCLLSETAGDATLRGGPPALVEALVQALTQAGVEIRTGRSVEELRVEKGRVAGVNLIGGESLEARAVVSALDPGRTLRSLVHPRHLTPRFLNEIGAFRARGSTAFVRLALSAAPDFRSRPGAEYERIAITGDCDDMERSLDALKYGRLPERPWLDVRIPTRSDSSLAPPGQHVVTVEAHGVPHALEGGWNETERARLGDLVLAQLRRHLELPPSALVATDVVTPLDVEQRYGLSGGHVLHGEQAFDQLLFLRPSASCAWYRTPIEGLTLTGPGTHPGGLVALGSTLLSRRAVKV